MHNLDKGMYFKTIVPLILKNSTDMISEQNLRRFRYLFFLYLETTVIPYLKTTVIIVKIVR